MAGPGFSDDPSEPGRRIWRRSNAPAVMSGFGVGLVGLTALGMFGGAGFLIRTSEDFPVGVFMLVMGAAMAALTAYVWRDMRGKLGAQIILDQSGVTLRLPDGRSLIHDPPACRRTVPFGDIEAVETRLEAYGAQGAAIMQRAYRLTRKTGDPILLFEERALGTRFAEASMRPIAAEIAAQAAAPLNDLPMAQGRGGLLGVWFTAAPPWPTAPLPVARRSALWRRASLTGAFAGLALLAFLLSLAIR